MTRLALETALRLLSTAQEEARRLGAAVSIAVVDVGGNLMAFARMDGAEIAGCNLAVDKAFTAVAHRTPTAELAILARPGGELFGLQANGSGRYVIFGGGIPLMSNDDIIVGAVGVSGSTVDNDIACAERAVSFFRDVR